MANHKDINWGYYIRSAVDAAGGFDPASELSGIPRWVLERMAEGEGPGQYGEQLRRIGVHAGLWGNFYTNGADPGFYHAPQPKDCRYNTIGELLDHEHSADSTSRECHYEIIPEPIEV